MGRRASQQITATKGALDPDLSERIDLEHYYDSLALARNCLFHPQGGFSDRGGFALISDADLLANPERGRLRRRIVPIPLTAGMITAPNGGTAANLVDQDPATEFLTLAVTATPFVVAEVDLGAAFAVEAIDVKDYRASDAGAELALSLQWYDGALWQPFSNGIGVPTAHAIRTTARSRRFGGGPGERAAGFAARFWRIVASNAVGVGQIGIKGLRFWRETQGLSPLRLYEVRRDDGAAYTLAFTERVCDIFENGRFVAAVPTPYAAQQIRQLAFAGGYDTLLVFHETSPPQRILRQGSATAWNIGPVDWTNIPALSAAVVFSGNQDEKQDLDLTGLAAGGVVALFLGDQFAGLVTHASTADALAAAIDAALSALPGVDPAAAALTVAWAGPGSGTDLLFHVVFTSANGNRAWPLLSAIPVDAAALSPQTTIVQAGVDISVGYWDDKSGFPRSGAFVQQRLFLGGFRAAPTSYRFSRNPTWTDFLSTGSPITADLGIGGALDLDEIETIYEIYAGRHLQIFTEDAEYWSDAKVISAEAPPAFTRATTGGLRRGVPLQFVDGGTLFLQSGGDTLLDFRFVDTEQAYGADPVSVLCPHLIRDVRDTGHRPARSVSDGHQLFLINGDGTACVMTVMRKQAVIAGAPWQAAGGGQFRAILCRRDFSVQAAIERDGDYWLETWTPGFPLDWATRVVAAARTLVTGLAYLAGRTDVWAIADDEVIGPLTVSGTGEATLPAAAEDIAVGLLPDWFVRGQTVRAKLQQAQPFRSPGRIYEVELALKETGALQIGTNGGPHQVVPLTYFGDGFGDAGPLAVPDGGAPQLPLMQRLFTGSTVVQGLLGVSRHPYFELSRAVPSPVTVKAVRYELSDKGD